VKWRSRIRRLEQQIGPGRCPACHDRRGRVMLVAARQLPDGTIVPRDPEPTACARCGKGPEEIIEIIEVVVDSRDAAARILGGSSHAAAKAVP
jgi:hypothetical protein